MTSASVAMITFTCSIKYKFNFHGDMYYIRSNNDLETYTTCSESELWAVMEDISDMTEEKFKEFCDKRELV